MNTEAYLKRKITELEMRVEDLEAYIAISKKASDKQFHRVNEYASLMSVSPQTIYNKIYSGDIPAQKIGKSWRIPLHCK